MSDATATLRIKAVMENSDVISNINQIQNRLESLKMPKDLTDRTKAKFEELTGLVKEYQNLMDKPHKSNADLRRLDQLNVQIKKIEKEAEKMIRSFDFSKIDTSEIDSAAIQKLNHELDETHKKIAQITKNSFDVKPGKGMDSLLSKIKEAQKAAEGTGSRKTKNLFQQLTEGINTGNLDQITKAIKELDRYLKPGAFNDVDKVIKPFTGVSDDVHKIVDELQKADSEFMQTAHSAEQLEDAIKAEIANRLTEMAKEANQVGDGFRDASNAAEAYRNSVTHAAKQQSEMQMQVQNLQQQIKNYFGLDEIFRKIGELARSAMDTVKELDAAMTETAVVTNFDVSDMWNMLPTYTKNANQLGSTIADVYNAATLYYQQGLTTTQSMALANETLKMARIGGIEAAEATDMMTAALRGFNMEINETSAQRINDVYSKLAAITAADTKEIGTAMERTASISKSANMDFETTSAFLAQMIETTREAPENLGTAMKTIVARFQEMKVDPNSLVDSEGERLDFNRVDKALKSVGISLVDQQNQFRNLDDVFLEISSRWDGMTQAQQRYIATIAAGSRQQSRFIAMMQDYDRTMELVDAAYTAEGAGQAQFEKTLESMDSKLNRLKNAWDQFAMGFMNADFLKVGVDAGTKFLDIFEKIITGISKIGGIDPFQSIIKSALTATAVFGGLLAMSRLLMAGVGKFAGMVLGEEAKEMQGWAGAAARNNIQKQEAAKKAKEEAKISKKAYDDEYARLRATGSSIKEARQGGLMAKAPKDKFFNQARQYTKALESGPFSAAGKEAGLAYISGLKEKVASGAKTAEQASKELAQKMFEGFDDIKGANTEVKILGAGEGIKNAEGISKKIAAVGSSADNAGASIQRFAMNLYGTPLQPFGMALNLVGQGLMGFGQLASGAATAMKELQIAAAIGSGAFKEETIAMVANTLGISTNEAVRKLAEASIDAEAAAHLKNAGAIGAETEAELASAAAKGKGIKGILGGGIEKIGKFLVSPLGKITMILAAVAAVGAIIYAISTKGERALKAQGDAAAQASQDLDTTKQALEAVNNDLDELTNNDNALDSLVKGTTEWNNQLAQANAHIIEMMGNYKTLNEVGENGEYKYIQTDEDGRMSITQAGQDAIKKEYQDAVNMAAANNAVQGAIYNNLKDLNSKQYKDNQKLITQAQTSTRMGGEGWTDEAKQAKLENENIIKQNDARLENAWKVGIHSALADSGIINQDAVETILTSQKDQLVDAVELGSRKENEERYAELMGYTRTDKGKYTDAQGNELTIDYKTVKEMLPEMEGLASAQEKATEVQKALTSAQTKLNGALEGTDKTENLGIISDLLGKNANIDRDALRSFTDDSKGESNLDKFIDTFSTYYDEQDAKILSALTGMEVDASNYTKALDTLKDTLQENADALVQQQEEAVSSVAGVLSSVNWGSAKGTSNEGIVKTSRKSIENLINSMETAQIESLANISESMSDNFGNKMAQDYAQNIATMFASGNKEAQAGAEELQQIMSGVDFSSSLATIEAFSKASEIKGDAGKYAKSWQESAEAADATAKALQEVYTSDDMAELSEDMASYIKEQGQLDATKLLEMADSSQSLQRYLDATGASAAGVARAFTLIGNNEITFSDLTPGLVAAANAMDELSSSTGRANKALENFEIKNDSGKYQDALTGNKDSLQEMADAGEWGNTAFQEVLSKIFGPEQWAKAYEKGEKGISGLFDRYKDLTDNGTEKIGAVVDELGDSFTFEDLRDKIRDTKWGKHLTDEAIDLLVQSAANSDVELKKKLESSNPEKMRSDYIEATGLNKGGIGTSTDIANQARLYSDNADKQREYITDLAESLGVITDEGSVFAQKMAAAGDDTDKMAEALGSATNKIINIDESMTGEQIAGKIQANWREGQKEQGTYQAGDQWWKQSWAENGQGGYDIQSIISSLERMGLDSTKALDTAREIALAHKDTEFTAGGEKLEEGDLTDLNTFADKITESLDKEQWVEVGKTIGEQIVEAWKNRNKEDEQKGATYQDLSKGQQKLYRERNINDSLAREHKIENWDKSGIDKSGQFNSNLISVMKQIAADKTFSSQQKGNVAGTYLQNQTKQLEGKSGEDIAASIKSAAEEMKAAGMKNGEIADALNTGYGLKGDNKVTAKELQFGEDGKLTAPIEFDNAKLEEQLANLQANIDATINITNVTGSTASGQNNHRFGTFARGSRRGYTIPGRPTLTGEEGEELVWEPKRNQAYMVGSNGPQFANISRDAVVWNAEQTRRIKKNSGSVRGLGTGARGIRNFGTMDEGAGGMNIGTLSATIDAKANITDINQAKTLQPLDATADITEANPVGIEPVPVKAKIEVENAEKGGLLNKIKSLFGKGGKENTIKVTAQATKVLPPEKSNPVKVTGNLNKVNPPKKAVTVKGVKVIATVSRVKKNGLVAGEPVKVKAEATVDSVDSSNAQGAINNLASTAGGTQSMTVNANTAPALAKINKLISKINRTYTLKYSASGPKNIKVNISPNFTGTWKKTVEIDKSARGRNYQKYNAYAGGRGLVGPKGRGGLALTGEEGYEVVWLPKQDKAMIVGLQGPQMINLPSDAVVWPYKQSKKILNNNQGTPINARAKGTVEAKSFKSGKVSPSLKWGVKKSEKGEGNFFNLYGAIDNASNSIDYWSKQIDKSTDAMDKYIDHVYSITTMAKKVDNEIKKQLKYISQTTKAATKQKTNATKLINAINASNKRLRISIDQTGSKKTKQKDVVVREGNLVNKKNGRLEINQGYITKTAKKKGTNAYQVHQIEEQLRSEAQSLVDTYNGLFDGAVEALDEAKKARQELLDKIRETYFGWENELTEIKNLQNKIDLAGSIKDVIESMQSLIESQLKAGFNQGIKTSNRYSQLLNQSLDMMVDSVNQQQDYLKMQSQQLVNGITRADDYAALVNARTKLKTLKKDSKEYIKQEALVNELAEKVDSIELGQKYSHVSRETNGSIVLDFDWEQLNADYIKGDITEKQYEAAKEYYEGLLDDIKSLQEAAADLNNKIGSLYDKRVEALQQMDNTAKTIASGMQSQNESTVKKFETISNTIKDSFDKLIDTVRKELDKRRKAEQNQKTEEDISSKMNRLAMLRADTSGGHQVEIAKLEKEIKDATQDYRNTLEDQTLDNLQEDSDRAAEQRERQISILQSQLEYTKSIGEYIIRAQELVQKISDGTATQEEIDEAKGYFMLGTNGGEVLTKWGEELANGEWDSASSAVTNFKNTIEKLDTAIQTLLEKIGYIEIAEGNMTNVEETFKSAGDIDTFAKRLFENGVTGQNAMSALAALKYSEKDSIQALDRNGYTGSDFRGVWVGDNPVELKDLHDAGVDISEVYGTFGNSSLKKAGYNAEDFGKAKVSYKEVRQDFSVKELKTSDAYGEKATDEYNKAKKAYNNLLYNRGNKKKTKDKNWGKIGKDAYTAQVNRGEILGKSEYQVAKDLANQPKLTWVQVLKAANAAGRKPGEIKAWNPNAGKKSEFKKAFNKVFKAKKGKKDAWSSYAKGGIADYTGPAWLDGTPSKPELVLNSTDTQNFLALRDVLNGVMQSLKSAGDSYNNNATYDINVNVDHISNDYDVDRMVERIKKDIVKSAGYRNVTQARNFR